MRYQGWEEEGGGGGGVGGKRSQHSLQAQPSPAQPDPPTPPRRGANIHPGANIVQDPLRGANIASKTLQLGANKRDGGGWGGWGGGA